MFGGFRPFTLTHAIAVVVIVALIGCLIFLARRIVVRRRERLEKTVAALNVLVWAAAHGWWLMPPRFDAATQLPLHMCHIVSLLASVVLLLPRRAFRALLYFWGIGLCSQALVTPSLREPIQSIWFWAFWAEHGMLQTIAIYDVAVRRYRPSWRDYAIACAGALVYAAVVLPIDIVLGSDYGFLGAPKPQNPTLLDFLGPWPQRIALIMIIAAAAMAALMLPWTKCRSAGRQRS